MTICWTDPAGTVATKAVDANTASLVNDLDLRLITGGTTHFPWKLNPASPTSSATKSGDNDRDNVEQVYVASPTVGQSFTVRVMHKGTLKNAAGATATQPVSIIISGIQTTPEIEFRCTDVSRTGVNTYTVKWNSVVGVTYRLQNSTDLANWSDLTGDFVATKTETAGDVANSTREGKRFWRAKRLP